MEFPADGKYQFLSVFLFTFVFFVVFLLGDKKSSHHTCLPNGKTLPP